jgi:hypothetical protein
MPYFDPMYPGYQKARPRITHLLSDRKLEKKPFVFDLFVPHLPKEAAELVKSGKGLIDFFGLQAMDMFSDNFVKYLHIEKEGVNGSISPERDESTDRRGTPDLRSHNRTLG